MYYLHEAWAFCKRHTLSILGGLAVLLLAIFAGTRAQRLINRIETKAANREVDELRVRVAANRAAAASVEASNVFSSKSTAEIVKARRAQEKAASLHLRKSPNLTHEELLAKLNEE